MLARRFNRNQQYSITALTDATGSISERSAYDAYGKLTVLDGGGTVISTSAYGNRYTYTGREWDGELGLYHYRARVYDPVAGRFMSRDLIHYVDGMSLYGGHFVPRGVDPLGLYTVQGPDALTISYVEDFDNLAFNIFDIFDAYERGTGTNIMTNTRAILIMAGLNELAKAANDTPPNAFTNASIASWKNTKEYRGYLQTSMQIECCKGNATSSKSSDQWSFGYTPIRATRNETLFYDPGVGSRTPSNSIFSGSCVTRTVRNNFRIGGPGAIIAKIFSGQAPPEPWHEIKYTLCCDKSYSVDFSGTNFPNHKSYIDLSLVAGPTAADVLSAMLGRLSNSNYHSATGVVP